MLWIPACCRSSAPRANQAFMFTLANNPGRRSSDQRDWVFDPQSVTIRTNFSRSGPLPPCANAASLKARAEQRGAGLMPAQGLALLCLALPAERFPLRSPPGSPIACARASRTDVRTYSPAASAQDTGARDARIRASTVSPPSAAAQSCSRRQRRAHFYGDIFELEAGHATHPRLRD
jgi:hypothetical protein